MTGAGAWLVGYAVFYVLTAGAVRESTLAQLAAAVTGSETGRPRPAQRSNFAAAVSISLSPRPERFTRIVS